MKRISRVILALSTVVALGACGDDAGTASPTIAAGTSASGAVAPAETTVNANTASEAEIAAALSASGIANAEEWAHEIEEYRPYDGTEAGWDTLRGELAKYEATPEIIEQILAVLTT